MENTPSETPTLLDNDIPEKFRDIETGDIKTDALLQSYKALERKMSAQVRPPKAHTDYCIDCSHGMFTPDDEVNRRLHARGLTEEQVQEVYDLAADKMIPMIMAIAGDFKADQEVEKLIEYFGGPDKWKQVSRQILAFGQKHFPADVLESMSSSFEGVVALYKMMQSGEPSLHRGRAMNVSATEEKDLHAMMRDPKYWRDKDPAFVAKVTEGFKSMYGQG